METSHKHYDFAKQFTKYPGGRLREHGPKSGEAFREDVLIPLIQSSDIVEIDLTGARGIGSTFIDESFGELAKRMGMDTVKAKLTLVCTDDPIMVDVIWKKMAKAAAER